MKVLLKHKNPLDVRNRVGRTPLGLAAAHNYEGACLLIAAALMNERYLAKDVLALQQRATEPLEREVLSRVLEQKKAAVGVREQPRRLAPPDPPQRGRPALIPLSLRAFLDVSPLLL